MVAPKAEDPKADDPVGFAAEEPKADDPKALFPDVLGLPIEGILLPPNAELPNPPGLACPKAD